jgi:hypothetical protein
MAKKISEYGENTLPWGRKQFTLMIPMYVLAVSNDLVSPQQDRGSVAPAQSCIFNAAVYYVGWQRPFWKRGAIS